MSLVFPILSVPEGTGVLSGNPLGGRDFVVIPELGLKYVTPFMGILVKSLPPMEYLYKGYL